MALAAGSIGLILAGCSNSKKEADNKTITITVDKGYKNYINSVKGDFKAALTFSMMSLVLTIMLVTDLIFILGGAFFLWLTRNSPLTDITTFKEATSLMLNILGPASLLSAFWGLFHLTSLVSCYYKHLC